MKSNELKNIFELNDTIKSMEICLIFMVGVFLVFTTYTEPQLDNDLSRFATVESLVERGTFAIEESPFHVKPSGYEIIDKVRMGDHFYSTKPPLMSMIMAGEYWFLRNVFGLSFDSTKASPFLVWFLTYTTVGIPFLLLASMFRWLCRCFTQDPLVPFMGLLLLLFGTPLLGFARTLNNHVPAAMFLFTSYAIALGLKYKHIPHRSYWFLLAGFCAAALPCFDLPGMFFSIWIFFYILSISPRQTLTWFLAGSLPPLLIHFGVTYHLTGGIIPIYLKKELYHWQDSYWNTPTGIDGLNESKWVYLFHITFGRKGVFLLFPILLLGIMASIQRTPHQVRKGLSVILVIILGYATYQAASSAIQSQEISSNGWIYYLLALLIPLCTVGFLCQPSSGINQTRPLYGEGLVVLMLSFLWIGFYVFMTDNYGGHSYGFRWFMFFIPIMLFKSTLELPSLIPWGNRVAMGLLLGMSFLSCWQASGRPWSIHFEWPIRFLGRWIFS